MWWTYALLSALFAALTAILAKIGIKGVDSNLATAVRTVVILVLAWGIVFFRGGLAEVHTLSRTNLLFLGLSGWPRGCRGSFTLRPCKSARFRR
ncbi:hypothetical protein MUN84_08430 [Hymenobacter sp. 5516J-16]|uniref:EamA family transporter n=1 Tax=Hymenobacter sp. 5516J-16 TaxID=2932253 RepID=UPI001FD0E86F|nr:hypothetical protein [Hymenobacter sp. 5516J-16]UOQ79211.1 hypothetical protein MUN84_08430 [Hymenobacter sp. 5516J-16]